jgi:hypothetical protein
VCSPLPRNVNLCHRPILVAGGSKRPIPEPSAGACHLHVAFESHFSFQISKSLKFVPFLAGTLTSGLTSTNSRGRGVRTALSGAPCWRGSSPRCSALRPWLTLSGTGPPRTSSGRSTCWWIWGTRPCPNCRRRPTWRCFWTGPPASCCLD